MCWDQKTLKYQTALAVHRESRELKIKKNTMNTNALEMSKVETEPLLIKAGDTRVKLGSFNQPPMVDCRVLSESKYQKLKKENDILKQVVEQLLKQKRSEFLDLELSSNVRTETCYILGYTPDILTWGH